MKILITGAAGFVGSHAVHYFLKNTDSTIVAIDSFRHKGDSVRLQDVKEHNRLTVHTHDLSAPLSAKLGSDFDFILNIASDSHVERSITDPVPFVENNVKLALNVLEFARKQRSLRALIQCSTDEVFGPAPVGYAHKEWEIQLPSNPYSASKAAQDAIAFSYWRTFGVPIIITHTMNMFGPMQDTEKFIPKVIAKVLHGDTVEIHGTRHCLGSRMYLHTECLVDAWNFLMRETTPRTYHRGEVGIQFPDKYNIVGEAEVNNLELAEKIASIMRKPLSYEFIDFHSTRPGHDLRYALDGTKMREAGWRHPISFDTALESTVKWYLENPEWLI